VVALVALRLSLGWHFLYEGVWKIKNSEQFTAEPFLTGAKGPLAPLFFAMVYDIDGKQRLAIVEVEKDAEAKEAADPKDDEGEEAAASDGKKKKVVYADQLVERWTELKDRFLDFYEPRRNASDEAKEAYEALKEDAEALCKQRIKAAKSYLNDNLDDIEAYLVKLKDFKTDPERSQRAPFQQEQRWEKMRELRAEAGGWIKGLEAQESSYKNALFDLLTDEQQARGAAFGGGNPFRWNRIQLINFAVTYGLTAIGLCLMAGFFTRLAALGGAAFMFFVVLTTWSWPGVYPPDPGPVGHIMFIGKDFIEMLALLVVASTAVGRWGGLDYFVHYLVVEPFLSKKLFKRKS
jgi:uncharacterized membrane protein YphA (DoxX/SURF4 family)